MYIYILYVYMYNILCIVEIFRDICHATWMFFSCVFNVFLLLDHSQQYFSKMHVMSLNHTWSRVISCDATCNAGFHQAIWRLDCSHGTLAPDTGSRGGRSTVLIIAIHSWQWAQQVAFLACHYWYLYYSHAESYVLFHLCLIGILLSFSYTCPLGILLPWTAWSSDRPFFRLILGSLKLMLWWP